MFGVRPTTARVLVAGKRAVRMVVRVNEENVRALRRRRRKDRRLSTEQADEANSWRLLLVPCLAYCCFVDLAGASVASILISATAPVPPGPRSVLG